MTTTTLLPRISDAGIATLPISDPVGAPTDLLGAVDALELAVATAQADAEAAALATVEISEDMTFLQLAFILQRETSKLLESHKRLSDASEAVIAAVRSVLTVTRD